MSDTTNTVYFFNSENGEIYRTQEELPKKKSHLYLVINRENLYFGSFPIDTKKRLKDTDILNIQGHFIPYKDQFTNIIYNTDRKGTLEKRFFFWIGPPLAGNEVESYFYDEIPESLIFKGDPEEIKNYTLFVFTRAGGYEIIYFNGEDFYSLFEKELPAIQEK
ncbi:MAG: hypothetical protein GY757_20025, partial [bacterium]|nr:hypothetical protein [bacterium]